MAPFELVGEPVKVGKCKHVMEAVYSADGQTLHGAHCYACGRNWSPRAIERLWRRLGGLKCTRCQTAYVTSTDIRGRARFCVACRKVVRAENLAKNTRGKA